MQIKLMMAIIPLLFSSCAYLPERQPWTTTDKALFGAAIVANAYDSYTTKRVLDQPGGHIRDPWSMLYFGDDTPSTGELALSKVAQLGLAYVVLDRVPSKWRKPILFIMTGTWVYYGATNEW